MITTLTTKLIYMYRHLSADPDKYMDEDAFGKLHAKADKIPDGVKRRYNALLFEPRHLLLLLENEEPRVGCMNATKGCESWTRYLSLRGAFFSGYQLSAEDITFLRKFGRKLKYCRRYVELHIRFVLDFISLMYDRCRSVAYCSEKCQVAD